MGSRKSLDLTAIGLMLMNCLIWSVQQIGLKATSDFAAPVLQIGLRSGIAALCVYALVRLRGGKVAFTGPVAVAGGLAGLLFAFEFVMLGEAIKHTTASHAVVFLYTAPIFAALGLHLLVPSERLALLQWLGILVAASGIAVAFLGHDPGKVAGGVTLHGDLLALAAGALWGSTTIVVRTSALSRTPAPHTLFYQLLVGFVVLVATAAISGQLHVRPTWPLAANIAFQALVVSFFSFLVWFWLLTKYAASQLGVFSFLTPVLGVVFGWLLLSDPLTSRFLAGSALVLAGVLLVSSYGWLKQRAARRVQGTLGQQA